MPETSIAEQVEIQVGMGVSFHVSSENFWKAQKAANDTRLTHFLGVTPNNSEVIGCGLEGRDTLKAMGCGYIAWVVPERA